jgi:hypothetical protein
MTDEIKQRLQSSAEKCVSAYEGWSKDKKSSQARETLQEAVHELRKVASRLEIELVSSERSSTPQKPMKAPSHSSAKGRQQTPEGKDGNKSAPSEEKQKSLDKLKKKPTPKDDGGEE